MTEHDRNAIAELLALWREAGADRWFAKDDAFDRRFRERFLARHEAAARRELDGWAETAEGALALVLLLDQLPRNAFRGTPRMYATDPLAREIAGRALAEGHDRSVDPDLRLFLYLPFSHSEDLSDQRRAVELFGLLDAENEAHARGHHDIVARFGRFPHRNRILGRETTPEEQRFLDDGGFAG
ncbi:MAG TPA: DUF924 family protein [Geminicoccaceae bacterium]|nr:DUF924 family protein [Geminicoccus sp.]HMU51626.1 DUF924 family protein [Geminicoccaceae bacterium]